jgi:hypothetical protein
MVRSASGWSHRKSLNSSNAMPVTVSFPCLKCLESTLIPALPLSRRVQQYRQRERVPGSIQAGMMDADGTGVNFFKFIVLSRVGPGESQLGL